MDEGFLELAKEWFLKLDDNLAVVVAAIAAAAYVLKHTVPAIAKEWRKDRESKRAYKLNHRELGAKLKDRNKQED